MNEQQHIERLEHWKRLCMVKCRARLRTLSETVVSTISLPHDDLELSGAPLRAIDEALAACHEAFQEYRRIEARAEGAKSVFAEITADVGPKEVTP